MMMCTISKRIDIAAAHYLYEGSGVPHCEAVHGHNWVIEAHVLVEDDIFDGEQELNLDVLYGDIKRHLMEIVHERFDHDTINNWAPFDKVNPTTENFALWILRELRKRNTQYVQVDVWENYPNNHACVRLH